VELDAPTGSGLSKDGTKTDVFPIWHLAVSISFEREVSANSSPILLIDFAPVFIYDFGVKYGETVTWRRPVTSRSLIDICDSLPRIGFSAGFSTADAWACGIDEKPS
jgi:hypothetical protein